MATYKALLSNVRNRKMTCSCYQNTDLGNTKTCTQMRIRKEESDFNSKSLFTAVHCEFEGKSHDSQRGSTTYGERKGHSRQRHS
jgi:hypothetical protein